MAGPVHDPGFRAPVRERVRDECSAKIMHAHLHAAIAADEELGAVRPCCAERGLEHRAMASPSTRMRSPFGCTKNGASSGASLRYVAFHPLRRAESTSSRPRGGRSGRRDPSHSTARAGPCVFAEHIEQPSAVGVLGAQRSRKLLALGKGALYPVGWVGEPSVLTLFVVNTGVCRELRHVAPVGDPKRPVRDIDRSTGRRSQHAANARQPNGLRVIAQRIASVFPAPGRSRFSSYTVTR